MASSSSPTAPPEYPPSRSILNTAQNPYSASEGGDAPWSLSGAKHDSSASPINTTHAPVLPLPTPAPSPAPFMSVHSASSANPSVTSDSSQDLAAAALAWLSLAPSHLQHLSPSALDSLIVSILPHMNSVQLAHLASRLPPQLKRDFLSDLPPEIALHILSSIDDVRTLARAGQVSRTWKALVNDEAPWKIMCARRGFQPEEHDIQVAIRPRATRESNTPVRARRRSDPDANMGRLASMMNLWNAMPANITPSLDLGIFDYAKERHYPTPETPLQASPSFSYRKHFKMAHLTESNWRHSGRLLRSHRSQDAGVVTSLAVDDQWIVVGLANSRVHVFSASTGVLARTLIGHDAGVWSLWLVSKGGRTTRSRTERANAEFPVAERHDGDDDGWMSRIPEALRAGMGIDPTSPPAPPLSSSSSSSSSDDMPFQSVFDGLRPSVSEDNEAEGRENPSAHQSDPCNASRGWGQANALVISGGCDKQIRVWDIKSGYCLYILQGHRSTIRCLKVFHGRPIAVSGSRDHTLRVWDVQRGTLLRTLEGHTDSVRCLDVFGDRVVSGSYDCTVRLWNVDTGQCLRVFNGHYHQVYTVAFDGERIASGGLDTTVRIWSASTGSCLALLQGHTALVCQLQLSSRTNTVITGSADGRIIIFRIAPSRYAAATAHEQRRQQQQQLVPVITPPSPPDDTVESPPSSPPALGALGGVAAAAMRDHDDDDDDTAAAGDYRVLARVPAHSSSVTGLQFDDRPGRGWLVSGGNDGRVQLWQVDDERRSAARVTGGEMRLVRDLTEPCEGLWKVAFRGDLAVICCLRAGRTVLEIWSFRPVEEDL